MQDLAAELADTRRRLAEGAKAIGHLQGVIWQLQSSGRDTTKQRRQLNELHTVQLELTVKRERLEKALAPKS